MCAGRAGGGCKEPLPTLSEVRSCGTEALHRAHPRSRTPLGAAVAAYAWDESRSDQIADGIDVGGIDVAGLTEREAESLLTQELIEPLDRDLVVTYDGVKYKLSAERLAVRADIEGMIDEAFAASQDGGLPTRLALCHGR